MKRGAVVNTVLGLEWSLRAAGLLLAILGGSAGALLALIGPGIYLFVGASAAYWQMR